MFSHGFHQQHRLVARLMLVALLPLFVVPWSQAHQARCPSIVPVCEMTCCEDMPLDNGTHHSGCPCQDSDNGCGCACCPHLTPAQPPVVTAAPFSRLLNIGRISPLTQRGPARTEQPPLPPPKWKPHLHHVGSPPTSVQTNHSNLQIYENIVPVSCPLPDLHRSLRSHPIQHGRQVQLLPCRCLLHRWRLLRYG